MGLHTQKASSIFKCTAGAGTEVMSGEQQEGEQTDSAGLAVPSAPEGPGGLTAVPSTPEGPGGLMAVHKDKKADSSLQWPAGG